VTAWRIEVEIGRLVVDRSLAAGEIEEALGRELGRLLSAGPPMAIGGGRSVRVARAELPPEAGRAEGIGRAAAAAVAGELRA
jgi:hypothetical protein